MSWTNVATTGPGARSEGSLVYDPRERAVILIGGIAGGGTMLADTWAWDGTSWKQLAPVVSVTKRLKAGVAADVTGGIVLAGGVVGATASVDLWRLRFESDLVESEACASDTNDDDGDGVAGCADLDCWTRCNPLCPPSTSCSPTLPYCGDATCGPVEDAFICPADCAP
jgi:hypothetical protein